MNKRIENKPGYKETIAGWIPKDWEAVRLEEIGGFTKGSGITKDDLLDEGLPAIRYGEIYTDHDYVIKKFHSFISSETASTCRKIKYGDILFAGSGETHEEIGKCVAYIGMEEVYAGGDIIILRLSKGNPEFLGYLLNHEAVKRQKAKYGQGYSVVHIYAHLLKDIVIGLPSSLEEQDKIAGILSTWDKAIELVGEQIEAKRRLKKGLMQQLLTGKGRFPAFEGKWRNIKLKDVFKLVKRKNMLGATNVLTASGEHGLINQTEFFKKSVAGKDLTKYYLVKRGEFAYNRGAMNGYPYGATKRLERYEEGVLSTLYICFGLRDDEDNPEFYKYYFESGLLNRELNMITSVGGRAHGLLNINESGFMNVRLVVPYIREQTRIADCLITIEKEIELLKTKKDGLVRQKKGLMQKLLTGEVRVKV